MVVALLVFAVVTAVVPENPWKAAGRPPKVFVDYRNGDYPMAGKALDAPYRQFRDFPRDVTKLVWPELKDVVKGQSVKHVKDFGWNGKDDTEAIRRAIEGNAAVIVFDKMPGPWRLQTVSVPSDKAIVLEKGVQIVGEKTSQLSGSKEPMFAFKNVKNCAIEGKGDNYIGRYTETEDRGRNENRKYNGNAIEIDKSENLLFRNLTLANNGCDGCCICGDLKPSREIWFDRCVFDRNTRQGVSILSVWGVYFRDCVFSRTCGLPPKCGLDLEPWLPAAAATGEIYLYRCRFDRNDGGDIAFSTASFWPVTFQAKECVFEANRANHLAFTGRALYPTFGVAAPSDIRFDDCRFNNLPAEFPVVVKDANFFFISFNGGQFRCDGKPRCPAVDYRLGKKFKNERTGEPVAEPMKQGAIVFDRKFKMGDYRRP